jgi:FkbH-like protein
MSVSQGDRSATGVAVCIVSYGTSQLVLAALPALMQELAHQPRRHVAIVDNASPDGDGARLRDGVAALDLGSDVEVILSPVNGGFAAGNNMAFAAIRGLSWRPEAVLLLNPDAEMQPGALDEMLAVMRVNPKAGFVGPRLENPDGTSWVGAFNFPTLASETAAGLGIGVFQRRAPTVIPDAETPVRADWVTGTATLIRSEAFEALGDMDDGYFLYYEEVDYMLQGRRLGWESWHAPAARILHEAGVATGVEAGQARRGRQPDYWFQSWARYFAKNHGPAYARLTAALKLAAMIAGSAQLALRGKHRRFAEGFYWDFAVKVLFARLSPPPASMRAATLGGQAPVRADGATVRVGEPVAMTSDEYRQAEREMGIPPVAERGRANQNPEGVGFWALVAEDFRTHGSSLFEQGFWAVFANRFGNWRMGQPKLVRAPATLLYLVLFKINEVFGGISLWYTVKLGRRVRIWHHGGIVLGARAIGDDAHIRQGTTLGVGQTGRNADLPIIGPRADIGAGACVVGAVYVGADAKVGGNALVVADVPDGAVVLGNPAQIVAWSRRAASTEADARPTPAADPAPGSTPARLSPAVAQDASVRPMLTTPLDLGVIALLGSSNLDYLAMSFADVAARHGLRIETHAPAFGTARMELLAAPEVSALQRTMAREPAATLVVERAEDVLGDLAAAPLSVAAEDVDAFVDNALEPVLQVARDARAKLKGPVLVLELAAFGRSSLGLADRTTERGRTALIRRANEKLAAALEDLPDVHILDTASMIAEVGLAAAAPGEFWHMGRVPFGEPFAELLARRTVGALLALRGRTARLIVLDLDNTLWGGVLGEDGIEGVRVGGAYPGSAYKEFQHALRALADRGIALAVASKNDEDLALQMISEHPEMALRPPDLIAHRINWTEKALNIQEMLDEIGLGQASCMFIDDNPVEREKVRKNLPEVIVPEFPDAPERLAAWLLDNPFLECLSLTASDIKRTAQYKVRARVNAARMAFENIEDFYRDLDMRLTFEPFGRMNQQRALQLFVKTNQFNTTTRRRDMAAVQRILDDGGEVFVVGVEDRHSAYELMGVLVLRPDASMVAEFPDDPAVKAGRREGAWWVDSFLLSCRILGRTIEQAILAWATARVAERGATALVGQIIETPRNTPVRKVFATAGFAPLAGDMADGLWIRDIAAEGPLLVPDYFIVAVGAPVAARRPDARPESSIQSPGAEPSRSAPEGRPAVADGANGAATLTPEVEARLAEVFIRLFRLDAGSDLSQATMDSIETWDSLSHLRLGMEVERSLGVRLPGETLAGIASYRGLAAAVGRLL